MTRRSAFLLALLVAACALPLSASAGVRIQSSSLTYLGTINVTDADGACGDTPNARATGLTYNPAGNGGAGSFYISGRMNGSGCIAEITKPALGGTATFLQNYANVTNGTLGQVGDCYNGCFIGGHLLHGGNLYVTVFTYYDAGFDQFKTIWRHSPTITAHAGMVGPLAAGPDTQGMYNQYMDNVPSEFQTMLGGPAVIGGCCFSVISRTSLGPALYAFDPANIGTVTPLVGYPDGHQTLNAWAASGSHPEANPTTKLAGVSFVEGTDTVLFVGTTGKGEYCYGTSCNDPDYPGSQGAHAYPYVHYMWLYDVDDLAQVKAGTKQMWEVFPYSHFELADLGVATDEWSALGVAYVPSEKRLYVSLNRNNWSPVPRIHVYSVDDGAATTYTVTPSAGANGTISPTTAQTVNSGSTTAFTVTPNSGYTASVGGTCGGSLVGNTYTTNAVTANCTVTASFSLSCKKLATPAGLVATGLTANPPSNATISWDWSDVTLHADGSALSGDLGNYRLYWGATSGGPYNTASSTLSAISVGPTQANIAYYARVAVESSLSASCNSDQSAEVSFYADTVPPTLSALGPTGTLPKDATSATLVVTTSEPATCRYSSSAGAEYIAMTTFSTTGNTSHSVSVATTKGRTDWYYLRCQDASGNLSAQAVHRLSVADSPKRRGSR